jgi:SAM-dependent methyltransferase
MKEKIINAYNKLSPFYENEDGRYNAFNIYYERPAMIELLPKNLEGSRVLDAGCAAGWYTEYLLTKGALPIAIDLSPEMVESTKRRTQGKVDVYCSDLSKDLPFEPNSFDIIISSLTLHYIEDWNKTFAEFSRVLNSNGIILFSTHHPIMDISMSESNDYFSTELLKDYWKRDGESIELQFYRRPMQDIVNVTTSFFSLDSIIEPIPTDEFRTQYPDSYTKLIRRPNFLIIKAVNSKK